MLHGTYIRYGNSEIDAHVRSNLCYLTCSRHLIRSRDQSLIDFFLHKCLFSFMRAPYVLSDHLIQVAWPCPRLALDVGAYMVPNIDHTFMYRLVTYMYRLVIYMYRLVIYMYRLVTYMYRREKIMKITIMKCMYLGKPH